MPSLPGTSTGGGPTRGASFKRGLRKGAFSVNRILAIVASFPYRFCCVHRHLDLSRRVRLQGAPRPSNNPPRQVREFRSAHGALVCDIRTVSR